MARTLLTPQAVAAPYPGAGVAVTWTAADVANGNAFVLTEREVVLAKNTDTAAHVVTLSSVANAFGRSSDTADVILPGEVRPYAPKPLAGWMQSDGRLYL